MTPLPNDLPALDVEQGLGRLMGNRRIYFKALQRFGTYRAAAQQAATLLAGGDEVAAHRMVHTLKGAAGLLGALEVQALAGQVEAAMRAHAAVGPLLDDLQSALARVDGKIESLLADYRVEAPAVVEPSPGPAVLLDRLEAMLENGDGAAADLAERWEAELRNAVGAAPWQAVAAAMEDYDFERALALLQSAR